MNEDRLKWWEDIPLGLALVAQSYVVGLWYYASISGASAWLDLFVAIGAGLALDLIVVTTVMGRRAGRSSGWSWATSLGAFLCSSLIALDRYGWEWRSGLHIAFPLVVFLYSQHLATPRRVLAAVASQEAPGTTEDQKSPPAMVATAESRTDVLTSAGANGNQALISELLALPLDGAHNGNQLRAVEAPRYICPHCGRALKNKQALGAAHTNGYCPACKAERKAA